MKSFEDMCALFSIILFSFTSSSWSYDPEVLLGATDGELQIKRFNHPPDGEDFAWLIDEHRHQFNLHQSDSQSSEIAQTQLSQTLSFQQPLTSSSENLEQLLSVYPQDPIIQSPQLTKELRDSVHIFQPELEQFNSHGHFVPNYRNLNGPPGSFWTHPLLQVQSIEEAELPKPYLSSQGHNKNLVNYSVANNNFIEPRFIPYIFENDITSSTFSPRTKVSDLVPDWIQSFENRNLGESLDHEIPTAGLSGASFLHENHLRHPNYSPEEFREENISCHPSPQSDIDLELFLNDLIHSPPHQVEEKENGSLGFFEVPKSAPQGVSDQSNHNKNPEFKIGKGLKSGSTSESSISNSPLSAIQQIRSLNPNVELHSNNFNFNSYSDRDAVAQLRGEIYLNNVESLSSQEKADNENNNFRKERQLRKKQKLSESQKLRNNYMKDFTQQSNFFSKQIQKKLQPGSSDLNNQLSLIMPTKNLMLSGNKKMKNIIDLISQEDNKCNTNTIENGKRTRKSSKSLVDKTSKNEGKAATLKKGKEQKNYQEGFNTKVGHLAYFGKHHVLKKPSIFKAESIYLKELQGWENIILKKTTKVVNTNSIFPEKFSTTRRKKSLKLAESYNSNNIFHNSKIGEANNIKEKQLQDLMMEDKFMFNSVFFEQIIKKIKRIEDIFLKSAFLNFLAPIRQRLVRLQTDVFYISPVEVSSFFYSNVNLNIDLDKYKGLIKETESSKVESQVFKLPDNIINWIESLTKQSIFYQRNNICILGKSWSKRISVITDIRKKFLENSLAIIK
ncbi:expressed protein, partial [Phakopsora pachyrhizi]